MNKEKAATIKSLCQRHMVHTDRVEFAKQAVPDIAKTLSDLGLKAEANQSAIDSFSGNSAMHGMPLDIMFVEIDGESVPFSFSNTVSFIGNPSAAVGFVADFQRISETLKELYEGHKGEIKGANGATFAGDIFHSDIHGVLENESFKGDGLSLVYSIACSYLKKKNFIIWS